ncbi:hypothetical protein J8273_2469 [Carpediemonas membranifera]|uniref:Uncharacterized protein n=1 Tax=Carpediemonas membranifera TaxID=201153 RepID=A0A8J6BF21_9EUKA|nr:hypothetical protein J8273_2469 [Carpediemonas membranifera]|eukprot:KAG9396117.1 hypothetical protein J8273_2469 [Carpediemonas membranifera]
MAQLPELRLEYQMFGTVTLPFFAIDEQSMPSRHTFRQDHRERRLRPSRQVLSDGSHHRDIPPIYQGLHLSDLHPICTLPGRLPTWSTDGTQLGVISVGSTRRLLTWSSDNFGVWFVMPDTCNAKTMRRLAKSFTVTDGQTIVDFAYSVLYPEYVVVTAEEGPHICSYLLRKDGLEQPAPDVNNAVRVGPDGLTEHERAMSGVWDKAKFGWWEKLQLRRRGGGFTALHGPSGVPSSIALRLGLSAADMIRHAKQARIVDHSRDDHHRSRIHQSGLHYTVMVGEDPISPYYY